MFAITRCLGPKTQKYDNFQYALYTATTICLCLCLYAPSSKFACNTRTAPRPLLHNTCYFSVGEGYKFLEFISFIKVYQKFQITHIKLLAICRDLWADDATTSTSLQTSPTKRTPANVRSRDHHRLTN